MKKGAGATVGDSSETDAFNTEKRRLQTEVSLLNKRITTMKVRITISAITVRIIIVIIIMTMTIKQR